MTIKEPLISVIVPIYNVEKYLNKCVDSIINQTYKNLEIILVDDGSPDNCPQICDEYAKKDKRIKVIHKENGGLSDSRNVGIQEAKGEYIGFIDSDDYIDSEMYEYLYNLIEKYSADISNCGHRDVGLVNEEGPLPEDEIVLNSKEALELLSRDTWIKNFAVNKLYKKSLFIDNNIEYPVGKIMEDILTTYRLIEKANIIAVGNKNYYNYLKRDNSITGGKSTKKYIAHVDNILELYKHFEEDAELGTGFFKLAFYVVMRMFIEADNETIKYIDDKNILEKLIESGQNHNYFDELPKSDKMRYRLLKINRGLYRLILQTRRKIIK